LISAFQLSPIAAAGAVDGLADARHEHGHQQDEAQDQQELAVLLDPAHLDAHQRQGHADAEGEENQMANQVMERTGTVAHRIGHGTGSDHDHAQPAEGQRDAQQPRVVAAFEFIEAQGLAGAVADESHVSAPSTWQDRPARESPR